MSEKARSFAVQSGPHLIHHDSVKSIMWTVVAALVPAWGISIYNFGLEAILPVVHCIVATMVFEFLWLKLSKKEIRLTDGSAVLTGFLLAFNLPPAAAWWLCWVGGFFAIIIAKQVFGGLGHNPFNPALAARVFLLISFPVHMTRWIVPDVAEKALKLYGQNVQPLVDVVTAASPLGILKEKGVGALDAVPLDSVYTGIKMVGSLGEMSDIAILVGGLFLLFRKIISWHIPVSFIGSVALFSWITNLVAPGTFAGPWFHLGAGGLMLGAWFMATDYVTSPMYPMGKILFGIGCGVLTMIIRLWGGYPEGVSFAILLMNAITPLLDRYTRAAAYGSTPTGLWRIVPQWKR